MKRDAKKYRKNSIHESNIVYKSSTIRQKYKPDHWILHPVTTFIVLLITLSVDAIVLVSFYQDAFNKDSIELVAVVCGTLIAIDLIPPILTIMLKMHKCKIEQKQYVYIVILISIMAVILISMAYIRFEDTPEKTTKPEDVMSIVIGDDIKGWTPAKIFVILCLPIATSALNSSLVWLSYNPIKQAMYLCEQRIYSAGENIRFLSTEQAKYRVTIEDYELLLNTEENELYEYTVEEIQALAEFYKTYVRVKLAERLADPASISAIEM